ncbi:MAG: hypothetical protein HY298_09165 [Verrucomicrobia bacterium]|nr:hypothetical protein [Verrucomicrobiota bacterium]
MAAKKKKDQGQKIIANMGLFWKRDWVRWKGDRGIGRARLAGKRRYAKTQGEVDFWTQTGIYSLYADYRLVYVGQAGLSDKSCLGNRLKAHLSDDLAGRWDMFSWFGLQKVRTTDNKVGTRKQVNVSSRSHLANVLEGIIIEVAEPPMNSQKGRFGKRVERYIQVDDSVELAAEIQKEIIGKVEELDEQLKTTRKQLKEAVRQASSTMQHKISNTRKRLTKAIKKVSK